MSGNIERRFKIWYFKRSSKDFISLGNIEPLLLSAHTIPILTLMGSYNILIPQNNKGELFKYCTVIFWIWGSILHSDFWTKFNILHWYFESGFKILQWYFGPSFNVLQQYFELGFNILQRYFELDSIFYSNILNLDSIFLWVQNNIWSWYVY